MIEALELQHSCHLPEGWVIIPVVGLPHRVLLERSERMALVRAAGCPDTHLRLAREALEKAGLLSRAPCGIKKDSARGC